jgi:uncharacterized coiled-coil DUF342 family protein
LDLGHQLIQTKNDIRNEQHEIRKSELKMNPLFLAKYETACTNSMQKTKHMLPISSHLEGTQSIPFNELQYLQKDGYTS